MKTLLSYLPWASPKLSKMICFSIIVATMGFAYCIAIYSVPAENRAETVSRSVGYICDVLKLPWYAYACGTICFAVVVSQHYRYLISKESKNDLS